MGDISKAQQKYREGKREEKKRKGFNMLATEELKATPCREGLQVRFQFRQQQV